MDMKKFRLISFTIATFIVLVMFHPLILPLLDDKLCFSYGDFTTIFGEDSGSLRKDFSFYTFNNGWANTDTNRFFLIGGWSILSDIVPFSDSQFNSFLILSVLLLGCYGIYRLVALIDDSGYGVLWILLLIPFYFLNLWSVDRLGHLWIWFTYCIFPLFLYFGLSYSKGRKTSQLLIYSAVFAFFGFIPHSFMYLLAIHAFILSLLIFDRAGIPDILKFSGLPFVMYVLLNMPSFLLAMALQLSYPIQVSGSSLDMLSRNGDLINLLAISNNWWSQIPIEDIVGNIPFRFSSISLILLSFISFALAYPKLQADQQRIALLSITGVVIIMFFAQGGNNFIIPHITELFEANGLLQLLGPFREWARICLMIPVFLIPILTVCTKDIDNRLKNLIFLGFAVALAINIASSPSLFYINRLFSPDHFPDYYYELHEQIGMDHKTLWVVPSKSSSILGMDRLGWNTDKTAGGAINGIGTSYSPDIPLMKQLGKIECPEGILNALNMRYVIKRYDFNGPLAFSTAYGELDCRVIGNLSLCINDGAPGPFTAYRGTILMDGNISDILSVSVIGQDSYAPSEDGKHADYHYSDGESDSAGLEPIYVFEGETLGAAVIKNASFSNGKAGYFRDEVSSVDIIADGRGEFVALLRGNGKFRLVLGNTSSDILLDGSPGMVKSESFFLDEGRNTALISGNGTLDAISLIRKQGFLRMMDPVKPAEISSYSKIDPTSWKIDVDASEPFLLGFSESYYPQWEARVYKDGILIEKVKPIKLYDTINGFWINETGELDIEVAFVPQEAFESGFIVTFITLAICILAIANEVRK